MAGEKRPGIEYDPHRHPRMCAAFARDGATNVEMAHYIGITPSVFKGWLDKHEALAKAVRDGKYVADANVKAAMYDRACGMTVIEEIETRVGDKVQVKRITKTIPPDVDAGKFWLANREPKAWRNKDTVEHTGATGGPIDVQAMVSFGDADKILERLAAAGGTRGKGEGTTGAAGGRDEGDSGR